MIQRLLQYRLLLIVLGGIALVGLWVWFASPTPEPPSAATVDTESLPEPTGDNVSPAVHARLMTLRAAVEEAPEDAEAQLELARFLQDAHRYPDAAEAYEAALALDPDNRQAWLDLTNVYGADGQWASAARTADRMAEVYPNDGTALYNAGAAFANDDQLELARARFESAAAAPDSAMASRARASLIRLDNLASAPVAESPPPASPSSAAAPPLSPTAASGPLPAGHPPVDATASARPSGRVVSGGRAPTSADELRAALADQPPLSARTNQ